MQRGIMKHTSAFPQTTANNAMPKIMKTVMQHLNITVTESFYVLNF